MQKLEYAGCKGAGAGGSVISAKACQRRDKLALSKKNLHSVQKPNHCEKQRGKSNSTQNACCGDEASTGIAHDYKLHYRANNADEGKQNQVDPAEVVAEAMTAGNDNGEKKGRRVEDELCDSKPPELGEHDYDEWVNKGVVAK